MPAISSRSKVKKQNRKSEFKTNNDSEYKNLSSTINKAAQYINPPSRSYQKSLFPNIVPPNKKNNKNFQLQNGRRKNNTYREFKIDFFKNIYCSVDICLKTIFII